MTLLTLRRPEPAASVFIGAPDVHLKSFIDMLEF